MRQSRHTVLRSLPVNRCGQDATPTLLTMMISPLHHRQTKDDVRETHRQDTWKKKFLYAVTPAHVMIDPAAAMRPSMYGLKCRESCRKLCHAMLGTWSTACHGDSVGRQDQGMRGGGEGNEEVRSGPGEIAESYGQTKQGSQGGDRQASRCWFERPRSRACATSNEYYVRSPLVSWVLHAHPASAMSAVTSACRSSVETREIAVDPANLEQCQRKRRSTPARGRTAPATQFGILRIVWGRCKTPSITRQHCL